jgi:hypothetical protein
MITNMSNVVLPDAAATPVNQIFTPASRVAENTARWLSKPASGSLLGAKALQLSIREPADPESGVYREVVTLAVPKLDTSVPTAPKVIGIGRAKTEYIFPASFTTQDKKDLVKMHEQSMLLGSATTLGDNIVDGSLPY